MTEHWSGLKPEPVECPCGCGQVGQPKRNGHPKTCLHAKCAQCRGKNSKRKGQRKQSAATSALGVPRSSIHPGHEEFLPGTVRIEVKAGAQIRPMFTAYLRMETQSEAARPFGDNRPFVGVAMPDGSSDGIVAFRLSKLNDVIVALAEQLGMTA